jgi:hypothetical protein
MQSPRKTWKTSKIFAIALCLVLLLASLTILLLVATPFLRPLQKQTLTTFDWAGYVASSNNLSPQPIVASVNGSWVVPAVKVSANNTFSTAWIGIGGEVDTTLIQAGSEQDSIGGEAVYSLWYELIPANSITIPNTKVSPGDHIQASIKLLDSQTNTWLVSIADVTTGQCYSQNCTSQSFNYNSSRLTAEWIVERPTVNNQIATLANFGSLTFTDAAAQIGSKSGAINAFSNYQILMEDRQNNQLVTVSNVNSRGSTFTVDYR